MSLVNAKMANLYTVTRLGGRDYSHENMCEIAVKFFSHLIFTDIAYSSHLSMHVSVSESSSYHMTFNYIYHEFLIEIDSITKELTFSVTPAFKDFSSGYKESLYLCDDERDFFDFLKMIETVLENINRFFKKVFTIENLTYSTCVNLPDLNNEAVIKATTLLCRNCSPKKGFRVEVEGATFWMPGGANFKDSKECKVFRVFDSSMCDILKCYKGNNTLFEDRFNYIFNTIDISEDNKLLIEVDSDKP